MLKKDDVKALNKIADKIRRFLQIIRNQEILEILNEIIQSIFAMRYRLAIMKHRNADEDAKTHAAEELEKAKEDIRSNVKRLRKMLK